MCSPLLLQRLMQSEILDQNRVTYYLFFLPCLLQKILHVLYSNIKCERKALLSRLK